MGGASSFKNFAQVVEGIVLKSSQVLSLVFKFLARDMS
jgi:hypothetical protein